ncbi:hypothetical protein EDC36_12042 [Tepidimonas ignava]|uniref:Uncharacterized protein n=1 Tax=Tepidimonas ignava TaxID=114249 RepID=A0A4R3L5P0_9BURK|nr:hypothetical protein [Tepidimonas ignava]TCS94120.1 hypothetical protein EDC36_12042 [Tepidimonas ignava]TSE18946.1 hypothetical protein Tigna_02393 [Tepidimonas ignava]
MEKQVIYRDRQELQAADLNNSQQWADEAGRHLVTDAITPERQFVGLTVTARSATEIEVSPGRLYDGPSGKVYAIESAQVHSVFAMLPLQDQKWLAVSVFGQEEDTDIQPRDFLIDLQTREVEPEAVAMQRRRVAVVHIAQGLESPTPERPEPPTGYTLLAHVRLSPTGVQEVVLATTRQLPNLFAVDQRLRTAEGWITRAEPRIAHIMSDIAGLGQKIAQTATTEQMLQLAQDMARVKERLEMPDDYAFYGADHFLGNDESDTAHPDYSARAEEGIRPPIVGTQSSALALLNPIDPDASVSAGGLLLPAYDEVARLRMETRRGEITINQYQYQTTSMVQRTLSRQRIRYGETRTYCTNTGFWRQGAFDPITRIYRRGDETWEIDPSDVQNMLSQSGTVRGTRFWLDNYTETYWEAVTNTHTIQGSLLAQTILMAQTGWLTSIELYFTSVSPSGGLTVLLCDAPLGVPDESRVIARANLSASALTGGWLRIPFTDPVMVESGRRYAIVLSSGAPHRVGFTDGTEYTQGILLYRQDGQWLSEGSADRDLMMRLNFARFRSPRTVIQMQPLQLAGGIADIDMLFDGVTPDPTSLVFEYQTGGVWRPITADRDPVFGGAAILPIRAVFIGTSDLMPAVRLTGSQVRVARTGTGFVHISTQRTLSYASSNIRVRLLLEDFDPAAGHTVACQILAGSTAINPSTTRDDIVDGRSRWREYRFAPATPLSSYRIRISGNGVTATAPWHVAERYDLAL